MTHYLTNTTAELTQMLLGVALFRTKLRDIYPYIIASLKGERLFTESLLVMMDFSGTKISANDGKDQTPNVRARL